MNITIFSLSLSNIYSQSPIFVGNNMNIKHSYILSSFSTFLFNPKIFQINHCYFNGIHKVLIKNDDIPSIFQLKNISLFGEDMKPIEISGESFDTTIERDSNPALVIHDCIFTNISGSQYAIHIYGRRPFYMTSCSFINCSTIGTLCKIETLSTTITHICMSNCYSMSDYNYFHFDFDLSSFIKLIFTTFITEEIFPVDDYLDSQGGIYFQSGFVQMKCSNVSQTNNVQNAIMINTPSIFLFLMNTVTGSYNCDYTLSVIVGLQSYQDEFKESYIILLNNIYNNSYKHGLFYFSSAGGEINNMHLNFSNCSFWRNYYYLYDDEIDYYNVFESNELSTFFFYFDGCNFDIKPTQINHIDTSFFEYIDCNIADDIYAVVESFKNDHFVNLYCPGTKAVDAFGCAEDNCLEITQCYEFFAFPYGAVTYTLIYKTDINTPTPSKSQMFSYSKFFTKSEDFTFSKYFSGSDHFSNSEDFTNSNIFSESNYLEKQKKTSSNLFTCSKIFSASTVFSNLSSASLIDNLEKTTFYSISMSFIESYVSMKSVSFSMSEIQSFLYTNILLSNGEYTFGITQVYVYNYFPYIIQYFSKTFVSVEVLTEINLPKKKITQEQLIGIVCGSVAAVFSIIGIILFFLRRVNSSHNQFEDDDYFYSSDQSDSGKESEELVITKTSEMTEIQLKIGNNDIFSLDNI